MKVFDPKTFTIPSKNTDNFCLNIWQPVQAGRRSMFKTWTARMVTGRAMIIGTRDNSKGCFSILAIGDRYDIAWNEFHKPAEVSQHIKGANNEPAIDANAIYFDSKETSKYLEIDLLEFLKWNAPEFLPKVLT